LTSMFTYKKAYDKLEVAERFTTSQKMSKEDANKLAKKMMSESFADATGPVATTPMDAAAVVSAPVAPVQSAPVAPKPTTKEVKEVKKVKEDKKELSGYQKAGFANY